MKVDLNESEKEILDDWLAQSEDHRVLFRQLTDNDSLIAELERVMNSKKETWEKIAETVPAVKVVQIRWWRRYAVAAVIILLTGIGSSLFFIHTSQQDIVQTGNKNAQPFKKDVPPGGDRATLTLADGTKIVLDSAANGIVTQQGSTKILKLNTGQLEYRMSAVNHQPAAVAYNTISTPKGGQYQLILPDGSKVWLNAASSLHFPTRLTGKERVVELRGEGYFEVAKNNDMPFRIQAADMEVKVLGTHFNVMAYDDEDAVRTTLLEGAVQVSKGAAKSILKPGEQASINNAGEIKVLHDIDIDESVAWKNGQFRFKGADINSVMRQLARWYNIEVIYKTPITGRLTGTISRNKPISKVLNLLELTGGMHFSIEGKKIIVME